MKLRGRAWPDDSFDRPAVVVMIGPLSSSAVAQTPGSVPKARSLPLTVRTGRPDQVPGRPRRRSVALDSACPSGWDGDQVGMWSLTPDSRTVYHS